MNDFLEKLLDGADVEWLPLGEVAELKRGKTITAKNKVDGNIPVISGGRKPAYYNANTNRDGETITIAGSGVYAGFVMYWNEPIFVSDAFSVKPDFKKIKTKYIFHFLMSKQAWIHNLKKGSGVPHVYPKDLVKLLIPIPCPNDPQKSLAIQSKIVRILDAFTELTAELTAELSTRKQQYQYYRDHLLTFAEDEVEWLSLGEVCDYVDYRGKTPQKTESGIFLVTAKNIKKGFIDYKNSKEYISEADYDSVMRRGTPKIGDVLITTEAPCGNVAQIDKENIALAQRVIKYRSIDNYKLNNSFLKNLLLAKGFQSELLRKATGGTVKGIKGSTLHKIKIPIPPLNKQAEIVAILDKFDTLTNSISEGLPKEIELRQKQYEYYREMLLNFPTPEESTQEVSHA